MHDTLWGHGFQVGAGMGVAEEDQDCPSYAFHLLQQSV